MAEEYLLGVDFGGGSAKATLLNRAGECLATASVEYPTHFPKNSWSEQDPEELFEAFLENLRRLFSMGYDPKSVSAMCISAASQTGVYLDSDDRPVRNSIYWTDNRAAGYVQMLKDDCGQWIYDTCCNMPSPARTLLHLMWIRDNEPENFAKISRIMFVKDYIRYRLTGDYVTDNIDAMGSLLMDVSQNCWSERLCAKAGISVSMLPEIKMATDRVGRISEEMQKRTGLSAGTQVFVGSTDTVMEVYANGAIHPGQMTVKLATAGRICPITENMISNPLLVNYKHVVPGLWYPGTGTKSCAASFRWYRDVFGMYEKEQADRSGKSSYDLMCSAASEIPAGSEGLFFHPYLQGELTPYFDAELRGSFTGMASYHTKAHFNRAILEGVGYSLKDCFTVLQDEDIHIEQAIIIGGGARSPLWRQIISDMLGIEMVKTRNADSSLGGAMLAGVASGVFTSFEDSVNKCVRIEEKVVPDPTITGVYDREFVKYKKIHDVLAQVYR